jgi:hypothetical protein
MNTTTTHFFMALSFALLGSASANAQEIGGALGEAARVATTPRADTPLEARTRDVARRFYDAFCSKDPITVKAPIMEALYTPDVRFNDPIFSFDDRRGTMGMWKLLTAPEPGRNFTYRILGVSKNVATVRWIADYKFPSQQFGRPVHNVITATLTLNAEGKIMRHVDDFSWQRWARQAIPFGDARALEGVFKHTLRAVMNRQIAAAERREREAAAPRAPSRGIVDRLLGR